MKLKLYIAVLDIVPADRVPLLVAHSVLGAHLSFYELDDKNYDQWLFQSFRKVILKVNEKEWNKICLLEDVYFGHENTTCEGIKTCAVVLPRLEYPNVIKFAKMYKV